jgi:UDP-N-acetylmuramyl tripeptide synthase
MAPFGGGQAGSVLVTGSSGKGTTCRMLAEVLNAARLQPLLTAETSSSWSAVTSAVVSRPPSGHSRSDRPAIRLVEVEPAALQHLTRRNAHHPAALMCTNILSGGPDDHAAGTALMARLERAIRSLPVSTTLILNADDPRAASLAAGLPNPRLYFGMSDPIHGRVHPDPAAEFPSCPRCGGRLFYTCVYYAHLGHWACRGCGLSRPAPDVSVTKIGRAQMLSSSIQVATGSATTVIDVPLPGLYNAYNALAAVAVATHLGLPGWSLSAMASVSGGPMRMERTRVAGHDVYLAVAADATGYTEVLRAILGAGEPRRMLLGLSARRYPHRDVSWIWDVDFELLAAGLSRLVASGERAAELALRFKYGGMAESAIEVVPDLEAALDRGLELTESGGELVCLPTYTAMLGLQAILTRRGLTRPYWERAA